MNSALTDVVRTSGAGWRRCARSSLRFCLAVLVLAMLAVQPASAVMISLDSPYGPGTITLDTQTGLRWLDITVSRGYGYQEVLDATEAGGYFAGYRLATQDEVFALAGDAGIDTGSGSLNVFTAENYAPVTNLMDLLGGPLDTHGNMGDGTLFDFTQGWITPPAGYPLGDPWYPVVSLASSQPHLTGRLDIGGQGGSGWFGVGAWLVQDTPEPAAAGLLAGGLLALALALAHRRCRSGA